MHRLQRNWAGRGLRARMLLPLSWLYASIVRVRTLLYRTGMLAQHKLPVPVVIVGNLIAGGAGKTPAVRAVVDILRARGRRPGIVSRGYGGHADAIVEVRPDSDPRLVGDEPLLLRLRSDVPVLVGRHRAAAARELLRLHPQVDVIVSDDGLQHLALARDVSIVVFDERGTGNGWLLPAGPLREPMPSAFGPHDARAVQRAARDHAAARFHVDAQPARSDRARTLVARRTCAAADVVNAARSPARGRGRRRAAATILRHAAIARARHRRIAAARSSRLRHAAVASSNARCRRHREGRGQAATRARRARRGCGSSR